jgi:hypothetical protein
MITDRLSRRKLNSVVFVLLSITLALLFVAPMPISLFQVLSVQSTFALLVFFQTLFTVFFLASFRPTFMLLMGMSISYGALLWSTASNWVTLE